MIRRFRNKETGQVWLIEHQDTIDRLLADAEFEEVAEEAPAKETAEPEETVEPDTTQEVAEEAPAKPKRTRKGS